MADFDSAYAKTAQEEGGYSNHPADQGSETYCGISRRYHPAWGGWLIIDRYKGQRNFPAVLDTDAQLQALVRSLFRDAYWTPIAGDSIQSQAVAEELYDSAVNLGVSRAGVFLQIGLNVLNRSGKLYPDVRIDGAIGSATLLALTKLLASDEEDLLLKVLNVQQGARYIERCLTNPTQETFLRGWMRRVALPTKVFGFDGGCANGDTA